MNLSALFIQPFTAFYRNGCIKQSFKLPGVSPMNGVKIPYFFVADDAFPLCKRAMKPRSIIFFKEEDTF